jgi:dienelactone hydrolase
MQRRRRWLHEAWIPVAAGMAWFASAAAGGWLAYLVAAFPGAMLLSAGVASALWPGDARATHFGSLGGFVGTLLGLASIAWLGVLGGLALTVLSLASFVAVGHLAARDMPLPEEVPAPAWRSPWLAAEVAVDEGLLGALNTHLFGALNFVLPMALRYRRDAIRDETRAALELFRARGWVEQPRTYHVEPPPLEKPDLRPRRAARVSFEHLSFPSGYEPHEEEPGRERWLSYQPCRTAHAWVRRHESAERPWLVCIHGYQMGSPRVDFPAFWGEWLHRRLGLNLVFPVLPLHGPRTIGLVSGDGFFSGDLLDTVHAEAQAVWDMRRILSWIRAQGGTRIGLYGLSLGGYNAALLASLVDDLACAIPGIPLADFARIVWWHGPPYELREAEREGIGREAMEEVLRVVAPLVLEPRVPWERRYLFGGTVDRLVPAEQVRDLWRHWERPKILWYPGAHVTFMLHREVRRFVGAALRESGLVA